MIINTEISSGYLELIKLFADANNLDLKFTIRSEQKPGIQEFISHNREFLDIEYKDASDTAYQVTLMSYRHLGFENMLCDYLKRCGIPFYMIQSGRAMPAKKSDAEMEADWQEHRKKIGLTR